MPLRERRGSSGGDGVVHSGSSSSRSRRLSWELPRRSCCSCSSKGLLLLPPSWHRSNCNPFRYFAVRCACVLIGLGIALVIGVVLYQNSLESSRQEFELKCDNIKEILSSEVENNLNASFVILGLVASVADLNLSVWTSFTSQTLFLRPNVQTLLYCQRVMAEERAAFEQQRNGSIRYILPNGTWEVRPYNASEYAPVVYETEDEHLYLVDIASYPILQMALFSARDSGVFTLSPPGLFLGSWQMGAYLAYYGQADPASLSTNSLRMQACQGYVATALNITEVFGAVLSRFADDADMDVVALYIADPSAGLNTYYNCSSNASSCALALFDPANRAHDKSEISVSWTYGTQNFELQCLSKHNLKLSALRTIIAWPLLMAIVVVFCSVIVSLVLKRMNAIEKDVATMEKMNADLTAAKIAAEAADKAKSSFLATVSHEIRTPMNGVIGMTNLLMGTELTAQQLDYVKIAQASGNTLLALINDVLDLSKIEAGKMEIECVQFDIRNEVDIVLSMFDEKVLQKQLEVAALIHDSVPPSFMGDPGRIRQVLINLVGNAMKFTKEGSIFVCVRMVDDTCNLEHSGQLRGHHPIARTLAPGDIPLSQVLPNGHYSGSERNGGMHSDQLSSGLGSSCLGLQNTNMVAPRISMRLGPLSTREAVARWRAWQLTGDQDPDSRSPESKATIVISVEDTGIGIPLNLQHRLFQPFLQADSSTSREYGGTGIGLSISQKLVKMMKGELTVNSTPGEGSVFEFTLALGYAQPVCTDDLAGHVKSVQQPGLLTKEQKLRGTRVILVDTHPVRQEASASYLRRLGIVVEDARDTQSTLDILRRVEAPVVRAVIVDLQGLDQASATQVVQAVRKEKGGSLTSLPVVALTCLPRAKVGDKLFQEAGFSSTVSKPLRHSTIATVMLQASGVQLQTAAKRKSPDSQLLSGKRLLVVDDNMVNRRVATSMLLRYGATVISSNSGVEAVAAVKNQQAGMEHDLILMDIQMPEMDGYEATRQIRNWEVESCRQCREELPGICNDGGADEKHGNTRGCLHRWLPIVAVTADVMKGTHEQCFEAGMDDYISKPLDQKQLQALLERFMQNDLVNSPGCR